MECIEARALKSSVLSQMGVKPNSSSFNCNDDVWCLTGINNNNNNNDDNLHFPVEDLLNLDFPEKEVQLEGCNNLDDEGKVGEERDSNQSSSTTFSGEFESFSGAGELAVPADDLENLEWLSQFVDDSTAGLSLLCPVSSFTAVNSGQKTEPVYNKPVHKIRVPFLPSPIPRKPRSKRPRTSNQRPWYLSSPPSDSSTTTSSNGSSVLPSLGPLLFIKPVYDSDWFYSVEKPPVKRVKKQPDVDSGRKCTHCQVNKTPQWRTGPLGPKTLCNACGVRYKSGRLFPEYRPACSPTFSREMHSNSHRKVLEMRRKKEMVQGG